MFEPRGRASLLVLVPAVLLSPVADAAVTTSIRLQGFAVEGASGKPEELELLSWSHGFVQPVSPARGSGGSGTAAQTRFGEAAAAEEVILTTTSPRRATRPVLFRRRT